VQWTLESLAAVAGQCRERGELGRYTARTRTSQQQRGARLAASAVSVARRGISDHRPLRLPQWKTLENSRPLTPSPTCWTSGDNAASAQRQCCASLCHGLRRRGRSDDCQMKRPRTSFVRTEDKVSGRLQELLKQKRRAIHASSAVRVCQLLRTAPLETLQTQILPNNPGHRWPMNTRPVISHGQSCIGLRLVPLTQD